jgi:hypothetical protein
MDSILDAVHPQISGPTAVLLSSACIRISGPRHYGLSHHSGLRLVVSLLLKQEQDWYPSTRLEAYSLLRVCHSRQEYKLQNLAISGAMQRGITPYQLRFRRRLARANKVK